MKEPIGKLNPFGATLHLDEEGNLFISSNKSCMRCGKNIYININTYYESNDEVYDNRISKKCCVVCDEIVLGKIWSAKYYTKYSKLFEGMTLKTKKNGKGD
jgi:hypothetical protein